MSRITSARQLAHRVGIRTALKKSMDLLGFDIATRNFYSPIPNWRAEPKSRWTVPAEMPGIAWDIDAQQRFLHEDLAPFVREFDAPVQPPGGDRTRYFHDNGFYGPLDAETLHAMVRWARPERILELGSGFSSLIISAAAERNAQNGHRPSHVVYDPFAREDLEPRIRAVADLRAISATDVPFAEFEVLRAGDILFVDTTHTVKLGSDVNFVVLEVLPRLAPGVIVHFHDIFLPWEYPRDWFERLEVYWSEQYLLQAYLIGNDQMEILLGSAAVLRDDPARTASLIPHLTHQTNPGAFWLRTRAR